jgi:hypothetical protein
VAVIWRGNTKIERNHVGHRVNNRVGQRRGDIHLDRAECAGDLGVAQAGRLSEEAARPNGQKLYYEDNLYKNAGTAMTLRVTYPERAPELQHFKNPVLAAFSNAVWHCATAARVCIVINEAAPGAQFHQRSPAPPRVRLNGVWPSLYLPASQDRAPRVA